MKDTYEEEVHEEDWAGLAEVEIPNVREILRKTKWTDFHEVTNA